MGSICAWLTRTPRGGIKDVMGKGIWVSGIVGEHFRPGGLVGRVLALPHICRIQILTFQLCDRKE